MKNILIKFLAINLHKKHQPQSTVHNGTKLKIFPLDTKASQESLQS